MTRDPLADAIAAVAAEVARASVVVPVGARTHWEVGGPPPVGTLVRAPAGVVEYDPAELTVTVGAGTSVAALTEVLADAGQECPLDPRDPRATVGGVLACGLSGPRRLRHGPIRDRLLEVHLVTAAGRRVKGGGRTVKNVTGYDVPRLVVGSLGTLGVIVQVTLRCEPRPAERAWLEVDAPASEVLRRTHRPSAVLTSGGPTVVLVEGAAAEVEAEALRLGSPRTARPPEWPDGPHRGRISVRPGAVDAIGAHLGAAGIAWLGEAGVGTVHVATTTADDLAEARRIAHAHDGWLLREAGAPALDGFGIPLSSPGLAAAVRDALDPARKCNPGRLPFEAGPRPHVCTTVGTR